MRIAPVPLLLLIVAVFLLAWRVPQSPPVKFCICADHCRCHVKGPDYCYEPDFCPVAPKGCCGEGPMIPPPTKPRIEGLVE